MDVLTAATGDWTAWALTVVPYDLPLVRPLVTSTVRAVRRQGHWLRLHVPARHPRAAVGFGEVVSWPGFGSGAERVAAAVRALPKLLAMPSQADEDLAEAPLAVAAACVRRLAEQMGDLPPEVRWGVELACLDILAQRRALPLAALLSEAPFARVPVHRQVASASEAALARDAGFSAYKMKLGRRSLDDEGSHVAAVRVAVGDKAALRLDVNAAWSLPQAQRALRMLAAQAPDWVEQPLAAHDVAGMAELKRAAILPVAADEGASDLASVAAYLKAAAADVVVLKPAFLGGVAATLAAAELARAHGARVCVTHAMESQVGCLGALHLAAALRLRDAAGLLPPLQEGPPPPALTPDAGTLQVADDPGLGPHAARALTA